jgi:CRISPR/Cas system-associated protein Cas7 (RAMP superfamily)
VSEITVGKSEPEAEKARLRKDAILNATPRQIDNYIDNNVTDLASAKEVLKIIAKIAILKP